MIFANLFCSVKLGGDEPVMGMNGLRDMAQDMEVIIKYTLLENPLSWYRKFVKFIRTYWQTDMDTDPLIETPENYVYDSNVE